MNTKKYISVAVTLATIGSLALAASAFADSHAGLDLGLNGDVKVTNSPNNTDASVNLNEDTNENHQGGVDSDKIMPAVVGKVTAISGTTLTVVSNKGSDESDVNTTTTFTIDTSHATFLRGNTTIMLSDIAIGDTVIVQGTVTGANVVATTIRDGKMGNGNDNNQALLQIKDNGQPVIGGTVSAINESTLTVTNSNHITYTVDTTNAKIVQGKNTIALAGVKVGDSVIVQGAVNGTSVAASTIIDSNVAVGQKTHMGFFASMRNWFAHLFGF